MSLPASALPPSIDNEPTTEGIVVGFFVTSPGGKRRWYVGLRLPHGKFRTTARNPRIPVDATWEQIVSRADGGHVQVVGTLDLSALAKLDEPDPTGSADPTGSGTDED